VPPSAIQQAILLLPPEGADLPSFRFDQPGLDRLRPIMETAELSR
jgi:hypothetical protein